MAFFGMEKNKDFIKSFAKWRKFVADYYPRVQLLTMPDAHIVEQARMAAQRAKLPAKYKNSALFHETNITASKDLFIFGSKHLGKDDIEEAPDSAKRDTGRLSSYVVKLCHWQRAKANRALHMIRNGQIGPARAKRALRKVRNGQIRKNLKPAFKEVDTAPAKRRKVASGREIRPPSEAPAASEGVSEGSTQKPDGLSDHKLADGGSPAAMEDDGNTSGDVVVPDAALSSNDASGSTAG